MKSLMKSVAVGAMLLVSSASHAALISALDGTQVSDLNNTTDLVFDINEFGRMTSAYNFTVNGELYDVSFYDATVGYANDNRITSSRAEAIDFAQAIIDQILVDGPAGAFDSDFTLIEGCQSFANVYRCGLAVPYGLIEQVFMGESYGFNFEMMNARNVSGDADPYGNQETPSQVGYNESSWTERYLSDNFSIFADIGLASDRSSTSVEAPAAVSEPAGMALLGMGAFGMMLTRRRKKQA